jgi:hypothetical protein
MGRRTSIDGFREIHLPSTAFVTDLARPAPTTAFVTDLARPAPTSPFSPSQPHRDGEKVAGGRMRGDLAKSAATS